MSKLLFFLSYGIASLSSPDSYRDVLVFRQTWLFHMFKLLFFLSYGIASLIIGVCVSANMAIS